MRQSKINGQKAMFNRALDLIEADMERDCLTADRNAEDALIAVELRAEAGKVFDREDPLTTILVNYSDGINEVLCKAFGLLVEIGSANPQYVTSDPVLWAAKFLRPRVIHILACIKDGFMREWVRVLAEEGASGVSVMKAFEIELDNALWERETDWTIRLARGGWSGISPARRNKGRPSKSIRSATPVVTGNRHPLEFSLADVADPPQGTGRNRVIFYLFPYLKQGIKEFWAFMDQELREGRQPSDKDLVDRSPVLKDATTQELEMIRGKGRTAHQCAIEILLQRYPANVARESMERYIRPRRSGKKS